jgi:hypothetical protein
MALTWGPWSPMRVSLFTSAVAEGGGFRDEHVPGFNFLGRARRGWFSSCKAKTQWIRELLVQIG